MESFFKCGFLVSRGARTTKNTRGKLQTRHLVELFQQLEDVELAQCLPIKTTKGVKQLLSHTALSHSKASLWHTG